MDAAWLRRAVALEPHLHKRSVPGDGDCQFHAVAAQSQGWSSFALRAAAVEFAAGNPEFREFFPYGAGDTLDSWLARMRVAGAWGDNLSLYCLAHVLQRPVFIYKTTAPTQVLVPDILLPDAKPILVLLDESRPGAEHYSPLSETPARKRLHGKQKDPQPPKEASSAPSRCLRHASRKSSDASRLPPPQRKRLPGNKPLLAKRPSGSLLARQARHLLQEGRTHKHVAMVLGVSRGFLRKTLRSTSSVQDSEKATQEPASRVSSSSASETDMQAWITRWKAAWKRLPSSFRLRSTSAQGRKHKLATSVERLWMQTQSWTYCTRCSQTSPRGLLTPHWPRKATATFQCRQTSCASMLPTKDTPHVAPQKNLWPPFFFALQQSDWDKLVLLDLKVDYKTVKGGRSPVVSKQKLAVVRGVWRSVLPDATRLSPAAGRVCRFLLTTNKAYKLYWDKLAGLLQNDCPRSVPTAELLLGLPGVEVAMRPWLYPLDHLC